MQEHSSPLLRRELERRVLDDQALASDYPALGGELNY